MNIGIGLIYGMYKLGCKRQSRFRTVCLRSESHSPKVRDVLTESRGESFNCMHRMAVKEYSGSSRKL